jgi:hypothetical protein
MKTVKTEALIASDTSIKFITMQVPEAIVTNIKEKVGEYQVQRRSDPKYIEALCEAVELPDSFSEADYNCDDDEAIDSDEAASYFANFDELIAVYKDETALPKKLVNLLLTSFADVVLKSEGEKGGCGDEESSVEIFIEKFYGRIGKLIGCNEYERIRP